MQDAADFVGCREPRADFFVGVVLQSFEPAFKCAGSDFVEVTGVDD